MKYLLFVLMLLGMLACGLPRLASPISTPTVTPTVTPMPSPTPVPDAEEEYYMRLYQGCILGLLTLQPELMEKGLHVKDMTLLCKVAVSEAYDLDAFDKRKAPNSWTWPPPTPTPTRGPVGSMSSLHSQ